MDFLSWGTSRTEEKRRPESTRGGHDPLGRARRCIMPTRVTFLEVSYFPNFLNIPKLTKNIFADFSESVYLSYHVPPYFHDSGVFQKDSFMCSSSVIVWIILLSTLIGVPEI